MVMGRGGPWPAGSLPPSLPPRRPAAPARVRGVLGAAAEGRGRRAAAMQRWGRVSCALARVRRRRGLGRRCRGAGAAEPRRAWELGPGLSSRPPHPSPGAGVRAGGGGAGALWRARRRGLAALPSRLCFRLLRGESLLAQRGLGSAEVTQCPRRRLAPGGRRAVPGRGEGSGSLPCPRVICRVSALPREAEGAPARRRLKPEAAAAGVGSEGRRLCGCGNRQLPAGRFPPFGQY